MQNFLHLLVDVVNHPRVFNLEMSEKILRIYSKFKNIHSIFALLREIKVTHFRKIRADAQSFYRAVYISYLEILIMTKKFEDFYMFLEGCDESSFFKSEPLPENGWLGAVKRGFQFLIEFKDPLMLKLCLFLMVLLNEKFDLGLIKLFRKAIAIHLIKNRQNKIFQNVKQFQSIELMNVYLMDIILNMKNHEITEVEQMMMPLILNVPIVILDEEKNEPFKLDPSLEDFKNLFRGTFELAPEEATICLLKVNNHYDILYSENADNAILQDKEGKYLISSFEYNSHINQENQYVLQKGLGLGINSNSNVNKEDQPNPNANQNQIKKSLVQNQNEILEELKLNNNIKESESESKSKYNQATIKIANLPSTLNQDEFAGGEVKNQFNKNNNKNNIEPEINKQLKETPINNNKVIIENDIKQEEELTGHKNQAVTQIPKLNEIQEKLKDEENQYGKIRESGVKDNKNLPSPSIKQNDNLKSSSSSKQQPPNKGGVATAAQNIEKNPKSENASEKFHNKNENIIDAKVQKGTSKQSGVNLNLNPQGSNYKGKGIQPNYPPRNQEEDFVEKLDQDKIEGLDQIKMEIVENTAINASTDNILGQKNKNFLNKGKNSVSDNLNNVEYLPWDLSKRPVNFFDYLQKFKELNLERPTKFIQSNKKQGICPITHQLINIDDLRVMGEETEIEKIKKDLENNTRCVCCFQ